MKHLFTLLALTIGFSMNAQNQWQNGAGSYSLQTISNSASGYFSTAMGHQTQANGSFSTAMGYNTRANVNYSTAMGFNTQANGNYSTAMGYQTQASGDYSTAMGQNTTAQGYNSTTMGRSTQATAYYSTAMGYLTTATGGSSLAAGGYTTAQGDYSTAMGSYTTASGESSTAMGRSTTAGDYGSLVIGQYNSAGSIANSATSYDADNTAFVIGNGTGTGAYPRTDAFKVMFNGDAYVSSSLYLGGTAITSTATELNLLSGKTSVGVLSTVLEGANNSYGVRLSYSNASNHGNIGFRAVDLSYSGSSSTTRGATGGISTAMGDSTTASGSISTAMGYETTASGFSSTAMGRSTTAGDYGSLVIGQYNSAGSIANSATSYDADNTAFVIGNGTGTGADASDAFKVMFNGDATLSNDLTVEGDIVISSDARLKANIVSLGSTIARLLLIDGKSYTMKKDGKQKIGVLAQDIQKVFPELVSTDDRDMLAVNYQGLVPVLINALKEQQSEINVLKEQEKRLERLEAIISKMDK